MEKIIIDGYNVLHRVPALERLLEKGLEPARVELILLVRSLLTRKNVEAVLVFDGDRPGMRSQSAAGTRRLQVLFSSQTHKADDLIRSMLEQESKPARLTLVSDDNEIKAVARSVGARTLSARSFYQRLTRPVRGADLNRKFDYEISPDELEEWIDLFNGDDGKGE